MEVQTFVELCELWDAIPLSLDELLVTLEERQPLLKCNIAFPFVN